MAHQPGHTTKDIPLDSQQLLFPVNNTFASPGPTNQMTPEEKANLSPLKTANLTLPPGSQATLPGTAQVIPAVQLPPGAVPNCPYCGSTHCNSNTSNCNNSCGITTSS